MARFASQPDINNALNANYILHSIIEIIDNKSFWETHYKNLEKEEKNLPVTVDEQKKYQKAANLDQLSITDYLEFELEIYSLEGEVSFQNVLKKLKEIEQFIPKVFNFKERLKLVLCAVCHMNNDNKTKDETSDFISNDETSDFISMVNIFNQFRNINIGKSKESSEVEVVANDENELGDLRKILVDANKEIKQRENNIKRVQEYVRGEINKKPEDKRFIGGASYNVINDDIIKIDYLFGRKSDPIDEFNTKYKQLIDTKNKEKEDIKKKMYTLLQKISFTNWKINQQKNQYDLLNKVFFEFIDKQSIINDSIKRKIKEIVETKIKGGEWTFAKSYAEYLTPFFKFSPISNRSDIGNYSKMFFPNDIVEFKKIYTNTPIADLISSAEDKTSQVIFNTYIHKMFSFLYNRLLIEEEIIKHEIKEKKKEQDVEKRKRDGISKDFSNSNDPLLRMFLMFAFDCIHDLSKIKIEEKSKFWKVLEENIGNGNSIEDEIFESNEESNEESKSNKVETSLFSYLQEQLQKSKKSEAEKENFIKISITKAKLIYLLQNYRYF